MFIGDLVLYLPIEPAMWTSEVYFERIDPNGCDLWKSPMQDISIRRMMLGGALGPVAAVLYALGFMQVFFGLQPSEGVVGPLLAAVGLSTMMIVGAVYHAMFVYTGLIANVMHQQDGSSAELLTLLHQHQQYLLYIYRWAALPGVVGSLAFAWTCLSRRTMYPVYSAILVPVFSGPLKIWLKRRKVGGLILCGGLTNLWNLLFFITLTVSALNV